MIGPVSPLVLVGIAAAWLVGLAAAGGPLAALLLVAATLPSAWLFGGIRPGEFLRSGALPLGAAVGIGLANLVLSASNVDPAAAESARIGPFRLTHAALEDGLRLGTRVLAIAASGLLVIRTTEPTRLADALVTQARVSPRFAYGALAAFGAVPRLAADLSVLRTMRRARGLGPSWHPRLLIGLLIRAIRHADQLALAMDARGFDSGPRTTYRPIRWGPRDVIVAMTGIVILLAALGLD